MGPDASGEFPAPRSGSPEFDEARDACDWLLKRFPFFLAFGVLLLTVWAIVRGWAAKDDLLKFTETLLSWKVIAGGLTVGAASTFKAEIKGVLTRLATK